MFAQCLYRPLVSKKPSAILDCSHARTNITLKRKLSQTLNEPLKYTTPQHI